MPKAPVRCAWATGTSPLMQEYHDREWGVPVHDDAVLFEFITLEGAQAGLSWETVLRKRDRLLLFSGCSGHGYKFAAFNGEKLAQVVLGEAEFEATAKLLGGYEPAAGGNGQTT